MRFLFFFLLNRVGTQRGQAGDRKGRKTTSILEIKTVHCLRLVLVERHFRRPVVILVVIYIWYEFVFLFFVFYFCFRPQTENDIGGKDKERNNRKKGNYKAGWKPLFYKSERHVLSPAGDSIQLSTSPAQRTSTDRERPKFDGYLPACCALNVDSYILN